METQLQEAKARMLQGELADFEFTSEMKQNVLNTIKSRKKKQYGKKVLPVLISAALIIVFFAGLYQFVILPGMDTRNANQPEETPPAVEEPAVPEDGQLVDDPGVQEPPDTPIDTGEETAPGTGNQETPPSATTEEPEFIDILVKYDQAYSTLFENANNANYKFADFRTKEEFIQKLTEYEYATYDFNKRLFSERILVEAPDGLYLEPQIKPIYIEPDSPYDLQKITDHMYKLTQVTTTELYGPNYTQTVWFEEFDGKWLINDIETFNDKGK